jgi:hypothetical protein
MPIPGGFEAEVPSIPIVVNLTLNGSIELITVKGAE